MNAKQFVEYAESIYRPSAKLISLAPANKLDWKPGKGNYMTLGQLLHQLFFYLKLLGLPVTTMTLYVGA
jgi:hypothetical protein